MFCCVLHCLCCQYQDILSLCRFPYSPLHWGHEPEPGTRLELFVQLWAGPHILSYLELGLLHFSGPAQRGEERIYYLKDLWKINGIKWTQKDQTAGNTMWIVYLFQCIAQSEFRCQGLWFRHRTWSRCSRRHKPSLFHCITQELAGSGWAPHSSYWQPTTNDLRKTEAMIINIRSKLAYYNFS